MDVPVLKTIIAFRISSSCSPALPASCHYSAIIKGKLGLLVINKVNSWKNKLCRSKNNESEGPIKFNQFRCKAPGNFRGMLLDWGGLVGPDLSGPNRNLGSGQTQEVPKTPPKDQSFPSHALLRKILAIFAPFLPKKCPRKHFRPIWEAIFFGLALWAWPGFSDKAGS